MRNTNPHLHWQSPALWSLASWRNSSPCPLVNPSPRLPPLEMRPCAWYVTRMVLCLRWWKRGTNPWFLCNGHCCIGSLQHSGSRQTLGVLLGGAQQLRMWGMWGKMFVRALVERKISFVVSWTWEGSLSNETHPRPCLMCLSRGDIVCSPTQLDSVGLNWERRTGDPVVLFVVAAPPQRCPWLIDTNGHRLCCGNEWLATTGR